MVIPAKVVVSAVMPAIALAEDGRCGRVITTVTWQDAQYVFWTRMDVFWVVCHNRAHQLAGFHEPRCG